MPVPAYLTLTGNNQGVIEGSCDQSGREGTILLEAFKHVVTIPKDPQSGLPSGKRVHGPMTVTKYLDKSTPKMYQALTSGEHFSEVLVKWFRIDPQGVEEHYFSTKLIDAIIVAMEPSMANCLDTATENYGHMEDVSFTYRKIIWTWEPDGIESEDDWKVSRN